MQRKWPDCHFPGALYIVINKPLTSSSLYPLRRRRTQGPPPGCSLFPLICYCGFRPREAKLIDAVRLRGDLSPSCATSNRVPSLNPERNSPSLPPFLQRDWVLVLTRGFKNCSPYGTIVVGHFSNKRHASKIMLQSRKRALEVYMDCLFILDLN